MNLAAEQVEVYTRPSGPAVNAGYAQRSDLGLGVDIGVTRDGQSVAQIAVADIFRRDWCAAASAQEQLAQQPPG